MRIISKFQDYYDCGVAYGVDKDIYFKRETTNKTPEPKDPRRPWRNTKRLESIMQIDYCIYFCGKRYNYKLDIVPKSGKPIPEDKFNRETCYYNYYYTEEQYLEAHPKYKDPKYTWRKVLPLKEYFEIKKVSDEEFIKRGVPYYKGNLNLPILKDSQFIKIMDPIVAFQEISMYLGVLNNPEQECEIDDEYRMKGHGMDCTSFRKSGKKKRDCK